MPKRKSLDEENTTVSIPIFTHTGKNEIWGVSLLVARFHLRRGEVIYKKKIVTLIGKRKKGFFVDCTITLLEGGVIGDRI